jgi:hypothetical protein
MPYKGEFAKFNSIKRLVESERVAELLGNRMQVKEKSTVSSIPLTKIQLADLPASNWQADWLIALDGGYNPVPVKNGYPGAEVGYVTVAAVLLNTKKLRELDESRPIDPREFRSTRSLNSIDDVFPGCNVVLDHADDPKQALRQKLFETLRDTRIPADGASLLDTYEALLEYRTAYKQSCPYKGDCLNVGEGFKSGKGEYTCGCIYGRPMYSTDAVRIHEGMIPDKGNDEMYGEIAHMLQHLICLHILRWLEKTGRLYVLDRAAIVMDGPLAFFGNPATLLPGYIKELRRINAAAKPYTGGLDILMIGIEKTGFFPDHFEALDKREDGSADAFPRRTAGLLTDAYIKNNIIFSTSNKVYGKDTYYGRKLFYKTASGARIVASLPLLSDEMEDITRPEPALYARLGDALRLLDEVVSDRYPNAVFPLISAHAEAAIPLNLGSRVLEDITRRLIRKGDGA